MRTGRIALDPPAASILARFAADDPDILIGLLLDADERQFGVIFDALSGLRTTVAPRLMLLLKSSPSPAATREERSNFARRQANAAIAGVRLGSIDLLWPLLAASEDPGLRSFLIDRLAPLQCPPAILIERLTRETQSSVRAALLLSLRQYTSEQLPPDERAALAPRLLTLYRDDPDPAVHSAACLLLKTWGRQRAVRLADRGSGQRPAYRITSLDYQPRRNDHGASGWQAKLCDRHSRRIAGPKGHGEGAHRQRRAIRDRDNGNHRRSVPAVSGS